MIRFRKSTSNDRQALLDLIEQGFASEGKQIDVAEGAEHRTLFSYLYSRPSWNPEWVQVAEDEGQIVAAAGYFPQSLSFEEVTIPVGAISPVVTLPGYRSQGLARKCLNQVMDNLAGQGVPLVFLWGLPFYYPKLGFVPVLPRYKTRILPTQLTDHSGVPELSGCLRECRFEDLHKIAELYQQNQHYYWLQPVRNLDWWGERYREIGTENAFIKEVPFPKKENLLVWENTLGEISGYLNYSSDYLNYIHRTNDEKVVISESAAQNIQCAESMIENFFRLLKPHQTLYIRGTPNHTVNTALYHLGGTHIDPSPLAGMFKVIDWPLLFTFLSPLLCRRVSGLQQTFRDEARYCWTVNNLSIELILKKRVVETFVTKATTIPTVDHNIILTRLIFGQYHHSDLEVFEKEQVEILQILFPPKYPFIWDANYLY
jgi:predicted N-acetyltransferase YhbS